MEPLTTDAPGTALVLEGGGMRASYTSGLVVALLEAALESDSPLVLDADELLRVEQRLHLLLQDQRIGGQANAAESFSNSSSVIARTSSWLSGPTSTVTSVGRVVAGRRLMGQRSHPTHRRRRRGHQLASDMRDASPTQ